MPTISPYLLIIAIVSSLAIPAITLSNANGSPFSVHTLTPDQQRSLWQKWQEQDRFLTQLEAYRLIDPNATAIPQPVQFGFLDYNTSDADHLYFRFMPADPNTLTPNTTAMNQPNDYHKYAMQNINFHKAADKDFPYQAKQVKDRYVWMIVFLSTPESSNLYVFFDAKTGEKIGSWSYCWACTCHHYLGQQNGATENFMRTS